MQGISQLDSAFQTSGGTIPHLLDLLWAEYRRYLEELVENRRQAGKPVVAVEDLMLRSTARQLHDFATRYLAENRVVESFPLDANQGVRLSNGVILSVCPPTDLAGTMEPLHGKGTAAITEGASQRGLEGITNKGDALPI
jgi:hypothetical protein